MSVAFPDYLKQKVIVFDGATGTNLQRQNLTAEDFGGEAYQGCNEYLVVTKPSAVERVHVDFLEAGAEVIETDTFGGTSLVLAEYGLQDIAYELNRTAAQIAKRCASNYATAGYPRFVAGSIGPTTKLPSLGHVEFEMMRKAYYDQMAGLFDGGVDLFCIETCQDLLQTKIALCAAQDLFRDRGRNLPVVVSVTIETTGTMLMGSDIAAALTTLEPYEWITAIGLNCATGPQEMSEAIRYLCRHSPKPVFCMPNAGLPDNIGGKAYYRLSPEDLCRWLEHFVRDLGVAIVGGCCGTTADHIRALADALRQSAPLSRSIEWMPSVASLFNAVPLSIDQPPLYIGERTNANGSKKFRELLEAENYDAMVSMAKEQAREGAHILDVCVAYTGRNELQDAEEVFRRFNTQVTLPLMIDSTEYPVMERALQLIGGRAIVNSVNLEDGEERIRKIFPLCKRFGAAVVALTIDEEGMAKTAEKKFTIAARIHNLAVNQYGLREDDLIFDTLTFTLGSGDEEFRKAAIESIHAIRLIKKHFPNTRTLLGISNISFGLHPEARHVINSVFLHYAVEAGLDMAIVNVQKILPLHQIPEKERELARQLIFDERRWE